MEYCYEHFTELLNAISEQLREDLYDERLGEVPSCFMMSMMSILGREIPNIWSREFYPDMLQAYEAHTSPKLETEEAIYALFAFLDAANIDEDKFFYDEEEAGIWDFEYYTLEECCESYNHLIREVNFILKRIEEETSSEYLASYRDRARLSNPSRVKKTVHRKKGRAKSMSFDQWVVGSTEQRNKVVALIQDRSKGRSGKEFARLILAGIKANLLLPGIPAALLIRKFGENVGSRSNLAKYLKYKFYDDELDSLVDEFEAIKKIGRY